MYVNTPNCQNVLKYPPVHQHSYGEPTSNVDHFPPGKAMDFHSCFFVFFIGAHFFQFQAPCFQLKT